MIALVALLTLFFIVSRLAPSSSLFLVSINLSGFSVNVPVNFGVNLGRVNGVVDIDSDVVDDDGVRMRPRRGP